MNNYKKFMVGIDPGFGQTGLVLRDSASQDALAWYTWTAGTGDEFTRGMAMAQCVVDALVLLTEEYSMEDATLSAAIEMHIWNRNTVTYRMQTRLLDQIESGIMAVVTPLVGRLLLVEHMPGTAKKAATGSGYATKEDIIKEAKTRFPADLWESSLAQGNKDTAHTLADAWAHSLVAGYPFSGFHDVNPDAITVRDLTDLRPHAIKALAEGRASE